MRPLYAIRQDLHKTLERLYSLKTKQAQRKLRDGKLTDLRREASEAMDALFKAGDIIKLDHGVNCTSPAGGGWGVRGTVEVIDVYNTSLAVASGNTVLYIELLEDWKRWGSDSFWAFETALRERGQDIGYAAREHAIGVIKRHLRGALSCRNSLSVVDHKPLRQSKGYQQRLQAMIGELRNLKAQQQAVQGE